MLIQITSGKGPGECELAVGLFITVLKAELKGFEIISSEKGRYIGSYKSVIARYDAESQTVCGTVQWICKSPYRPKCKRKNWFIGVNQLTEPDGCAYEQVNGNIIIQTYKSGGRGGQHVNKTETAVRAIDGATGLSAVSSEERSQHLNKKTALGRLKEKLKSIAAENDYLMQGEQNKNHSTLKRGQPVRTYEGTAFKRVL